MLGTGDDGHAILPIGGQQADVAAAAGSPSKGDALIRRVGGQRRVEVGKAPVGFPLGVEGS